MAPLKNTTTVSKILYSIERFRNSENFFVGIFRDLLFIGSMILLFMLMSQILLGLPMPAVAVESGSMIPHINIGDVVIIQSYDRTDIVTYNEAIQSDYESFDYSGDVILYYKYGNTSVTPIIHRAMYRVDIGDPMWTNGPPAPHAGYITKGDNIETNKQVDQATSISKLQPVKEEWVIGVARWRIPLIGQVSLIRSKIWNGITNPEKKDN
ncbi:MAG: S26 family signal peptidase [Methanosarcinales archaeon]|nr:S26 family signal peptidase [Methanosarcinales archaeon]